MRRRKRVIKGAATFLAAAQCVMPVMAATAGVWEMKDGGWAYKTQDGTYLTDTWLRDPADGHLYHLNAAGVMDSGWLLKDGIWYFLTTEHNGSFGAAAENTWAWVDGYCYYFGADGKMAASCVTPDGFTVNADGQWTENGTAVYVAGRGYQTKVAPAANTLPTTTRSGGGGGGGGGGSSSGGGSYSSGSSHSSGGSSSGSSGSSSSGGNSQSSSGSSGSQSSGGQSSGNEDVQTLYTYTVRYTDEDGKLLASYVRSAAKDSIITADEKTFDGYRKRDEGLSMFHLTMDNAVFAVVYVKTAADTGTTGGTGSEGSQGSETDPGTQDSEEKDICSYTVRHIGPLGEVLAEEPGSAKTGSTVNAVTGSFAGYYPVEGQDTSFTLEMDGQIFTLYYAAEGFDEDGGQTGECSYIIYHMGTDGKLLKTETGTGKAGDTITIQAGSFSGYTEKAGQEHERTLQAGKASFTLLYEPEGETECGYTIRYAAMDGTKLGEETGSATLGGTVEIPVKTFDGYREIENQSHTVTVTSDGELFSIKYEPVREEEDLPLEPEHNADGGSDEENEGQEMYAYRFSFVAGSSKIGHMAGSAAPDSELSLPGVRLDGYEVTSLEDSYTLDRDNKIFTIQCEKEPGEATPSEAADTAYPYEIEYRDRDTQELIAEEAGLAYAGSGITPCGVPDGYTAVDDEDLPVSEDEASNKFTVWCLSDTYELPAGMVEYTISCAGPDGDILRTFTGTAQSGSVIHPDYEIPGYDVVTDLTDGFTVTEEDFTFEIEYAPYETAEYEFRVTDIDSGTVLKTVTMEGRVGAQVSVTLTEDDFSVDGYELLSDIPETVAISGNQSNNDRNIYVKKKREAADIQDMRTYVVHFVSYHNPDHQIFEDRVGTAPAGSDVTISFLKAVSLPDGYYEAVAQGDSLTFHIDPQTYVSEFYVYYYRTEEYDQSEAGEVGYSIRLYSPETNSTLAVQTGKAKPGTQISIRNTFEGYTLETGQPSLFTVSADVDENYVSIPLLRIVEPAPEVNPATGKYDGATWLITFTDELGNQILPWRNGFTRMGDLLYAEYPDTVIGEDGSVYRAVTEGPLVERINGVVHRQFRIVYRKGDSSENLLEKWEKKAQAAFDELTRETPYRYTVVYREKDSWNDIAVYSGTGIKGSTINVQGIEIPGYTIKEADSFVLDMDGKLAVCYCERIDGKHSMQMEKNDYKIRFTDGNGNDLLPSIEGYMAFTGSDAHAYMPLHYPNTFRDAAGDIWQADLPSPAQLEMWNLDENQFEITYHKIFTNGHENLFARNADEARGILEEAAMLTSDADRHSYIVIGKDYNPVSTEVGSVVYQYDIAGYSTQKLDEFVLDGVHYYVVEVGFSRKWDQETCTHDMEVTSRVEAGCAVTGAETRTCRKCGYSETTYFHAAGHEDQDYDGMCDNCGTMMTMNIGDEITVTWEPGILPLEPLEITFVCIDTDYHGTGKKLLYAVDAIPPTYYGCYSRDGGVDDPPRAGYASSDLKAFLEDEFLDGLSNRTVLTSVEGRTVGLLTKDEYDMYKGQAANRYRFPSGLTILDNTGDDSDGLVPLSDGKRVTPKEAGIQPVHPVIFMDGGGATEGMVSGRWEVGDYQSRYIGGKSYLFRCVNDNYKDNSNLDKSMALFLCDTVLPSYEGLGYNEDNSKRDTRAFGETNNYRYSAIRQFLNENQRQTASMVTMDVGILNEYEGSTAAGAFETLNQKDLVRHKRSVAQYLEEKLFIPSVEEALDMLDYLWKFDRSDSDNIEAVYDGQYLTAYWLRTPVYGTQNMVYTVNLKDGRIEPHEVSEEYGIPDTHAYQEYSADNGNTWYPCSDGSTVVDELGSYLVREKAAGDPVTPVAGGNGYVLSNTTSAQEYSTDNGSSWHTCSDGQTQVGTANTCLVRTKGYSFQAQGTAANVLANTTASMEWYDTTDSTWKTCAERYTQVPKAGTYAVRQKSNPEGQYGMSSTVMYRVSGADYGFEFSADGKNWQLCTGQDTYATVDGPYTVRRTGAGVDREAVKKTCSVGIRPMYVVYQED